MWWHWCWIGTLPGLESPQFHVAFDPAMFDKNNVKDITTQSTKWQIRSGFVTQRRELQTKPDQTANTARIPGPAGGGSRTANRRRRGRDKKRFGGNLKNVDPVDYGGQPTPPTGSEIPRKAQIVERAETTT